MGYKWNGKKASRKVHICDENGMTFCKAENGGSTFDTTSNDKPAGRKLCYICIKLQKEHGVTRGDRIERMRGALDWIAARCNSTDSPGDIIKDVREMALRAK